MSSFRITPRARDDIKSIGHYTDRHWGKTQRNIYLTASIFEIAAETKQQAGHQKRCAPD